MGLDDNYKEWHKHAFESKIENVYDIKMLNDMNSIHDSELNNTAEWNLLHDILNHAKRTKI